MEDLHDALENAHYEECITDRARGNVPSPIMKWNAPSNPEQLEVFIKRLEQEYERKIADKESENIFYKPGSCEWVLENGIGYFMLCTYIWDMNLTTYYERVFPTLTTSGSTAVSEDSASKFNSKRDMNRAQSMPLHFNKQSFNVDSGTTGYRRTPQGVLVSQRNILSRSADGDDSVPPLPVELMNKYRARRSQIKFLHDVTRYRRLATQVADADPDVTATRVKDMIEEYIQNDLVSFEESIITQDYKLLDLDYEETPPRMSPKSVIFTQEEIDRLVSENIDPHEFKSNSLGFKKGSLIVLHAIKAASSITSSKRSENGERTQNASLSCDLFDQMEAIVIEQLKQVYFPMFKESDHYQRFLKLIWLQEQQIHEEDFAVIRKIGRGGFGLVHAVKRGCSGKLYAMKAMDKKRVKVKKAEKLVLNERTVLAQVNSPFVVNLVYAFQSNHDIFLILDLMTGGDLGFHLAQRIRFTPEEARYYAACIMFGLQDIHDQNYVYRDVKPENILMGDDGRIKLTDLGLACKVSDNLHGAAGTRGYWAPEMLRRDKNGKRMSYGVAVDWFSYGCLIAEFLTGKSPFRSDKAVAFGYQRGLRTKEQAIDCAILEMTPELDPKYFDVDAKDLVEKLLEKDETKRLGYKKGVLEIMVHPFFKDLDLEMVISNQAKPPFVPAREVNAASQSAIGEFEVTQAYRNTMLEKTDFAAYDKWNWTNAKAYAHEVVEFLAFERKIGKPILPTNVGDGCCCSIS